VLTYLDDATRAEEYDLQYDFFDPKNRSVTETPMSVMQCPTSPPNRFIEIQSQATTKSLNEDKDTVFQCRGAVTDFIASNGVLMTDQGYGINALANEERLGNQRQPMTDNENLSLSKITDGLSNTLLLIEQAGRPDVWRKRAKNEGVGQFGLSPNARGAWAGWGSIAFGAADSETGETPGRGHSTDCSVNCNNWFGIYGFHDGGANVLLCDGSVRFIGIGLDPLTFAYLTIRDDGHMIHQGDLE
jgi:prepilin-type processing-associated H-X9-DG protein